MPRTSEGQRPPEAAVRAAIQAMQILKEHWVNVAICCTRVGEYGEDQQFSIEHNEKGENDDD